MPKNKCWNCERRHVGCHITCEDYLEFRKKQDELLKAKGFEREAEVLVVQRTVEKANILAMKRKAGLK